MTSHLPDVIDQLAGLTADTPVGQLRRQRPEVVGYAQSTYLAVVEPAAPGDLSLIERALAALRVVLVTPSQPAILWYRALAERQGTDVAHLDWLTAGAGLSPTTRLAAVIRHVDRLTQAPHLATAADLADLTAAGLTAAAIVGLTQLVALVSYQVRLVAGLRALSGQTQGQANLPIGFAAPAAGWTLAALRWRPWLPTVDEIGATAEQLAVVAKVAPSPDSRPYYATLAHDAAVLTERTGLFNSIMYGPGGLRRADRELGTVVASRINGCPYCASVHARRYAQLTHDEALVGRLLADGVAAPLPERERALVDLAALVTERSDRLAAADLAPARRAGLSDAELLDLIQATAMFANANRLMQTLGEPVLPAD